MTPTLTEAARTILTNLEDLEHAQATVETGEPGQKENAITARQRQAAIRSALAFLEDRKHPVVFIGSVGVGKSSLLGVLAELLVGDPPSSRTSLKDSSVLAIGSGRTTVCEVRIRASAPGDGGAVGLVLEPLPPDEMKREIALYAEDEWTRKQNDSRRPTEDDSDPTSQEVHRAIRGMTDYVERQDTYLEGGLRRRRNVWPLDEVIPRFPSGAALAEHLIERANLPLRRETQWWWPALDEPTLKELKARFEAVNRGLWPTAMLPRRMTVVVPVPLPASTAGLDLTLIDTRGLDGGVESRGDLLELLRDPRTVPILCASFKDAPDDTVRGVLRAMTTNAELRRALPRTLVVLVDQGDAEQVNGADGDREFGQQLKIDECYAVLDGAGLSGKLEKDQIVAFDALRDDRRRLIAGIDQRLSRLREAAAKDLEGLVRDAEQFRAGARDTVLPGLRRKVDERLKQVLAAHPLSGAPLRDPLEGAYTAIRGCRYASVVYATCRRNGTYSKLDLYTAVGQEAAVSAVLWLHDLVEAVRVAMQELEGDRDLASVQDHVRLRKRQFEEGELLLLRDYAERVEDEVRENLWPDPVWQACSGEWKQGSGFKNRVLSHLESWSHRQQEVTAHEDVHVEDFLPLIGEATRPAQPPRFTIHVQNLRALRRVSWQPDQVCALIGANGTGKTTLLETLRLLRLAYERGLSGAINIVFQGGNNLRSWGAAEDEPIELGVDLGDASWRIELIAREGSVADVTRETLVDRGREIFTKDSLGNFTHGRERIEAGPHIGLRTLMDRGAHEPAIRRMASFLQAIHVYRDPDLVSLREGSRTTDDRSLLSRSANALTVLRRWFQERAHRHRYQFVLEGLDAAFPNKVSDLDFREAGNNLVAHVFRPRVEASSPLSDEANGVLQMLVLLCQVAGAEDESVVAIDEPENGLHPYALRAFLRRTTGWAREHNLTVLLATHSTVLLDKLGGQPEQVYVMKTKTGEPEGTVPTRLDELVDRTWLEEYKLGDLYERGDIGSNEDAG